MVKQIVIGLAVIAVLWIVWFVLAVRRAFRYFEDEE
jgi:hypothetical protein